MSFSEGDLLGRSAASRLEAGDFASAFAAADRLCRTAHVDGRILHVRATALRKLGQNENADRDLEEAFAYDPSDPLISRAILNSSLAHLHVAAAEALVGSPTANSRSVSQALVLLLSKRSKVVGQLVAVGGRLTGWIAWSAKAGLKNVSISIDGGQEIAIAGAPDHLYAARDLHVAHVDVLLATHQVRGRTSNVRSWPVVQVLHQSKAIDQASIAVHFLSEVPDRLTSSPGRPAVHGLVEPAPCTVVVPIYADEPTTRLCLEALAYQQVRNKSIKVILVNDRPDCAAIVDLARSTAAANGFELIENPTNRGFVLSVNIALARITSGDVLLLNSDAILPLRAISRLRTAAYGEADIGTVTPLSNNGELTSFPVPFRPNDMGSVDDIESIDAVARVVNCGRTVTIPCGTGFCLYIRADCYAAVGALSHHYHRGYYEDAEFCLRARNAGFKNVCATNVYVGHKGTSSFQDEKRQLVMRNLKVFEARFPQVADEVLAFVKADPLRNVRIAIIERMPRAKASVGAVLGAAGSHSLDIYAEQMREQGFQVVVLAASAGGYSVGLSFRKDDGIYLQDQHFDFRIKGERRRFCRELRRLGVAKIEVIDQVAPIFMIERLRKIGIDVCMLVNGSPFATCEHPASAACESFVASGPCVVCRKTRGPAWHAVGSDRFTSILSMIREGSRPRAMNPMAEAILQRFAMSTTSGTPPRVGPDIQKKAKATSPSRAFRSIAALIPASFGTASRSDPPPQQSAIFERSASCLRCRRWLATA